MSDLDSKQISATDIITKFIDETQYNQIKFNVFLYGLITRCVYLIHKLEIIDKDLYDEANITFYNYSNKILEDINKRILDILSHNIKL